MYSQEIYESSNGGKVLKEIEYHKDLNGGVYIDSVFKYPLNSKDDYIKSRIINIFQNYGIPRVYTCFKDMQVFKQNDVYIVEMPVLCRYIVEKDYSLRFSFNEGNEVNWIANSLDEQFKTLLTQMCKDLIVQHENVLKDLIYYELGGE